jgi:hypothetical protein
MKHFDLGRHTRHIATRSTEAQRCFDLGLNWSFGFNHEEGVKCFEKALEADPGCVMAHWGVAYALGPFYNLAWRELGEREAAAAIGLAWRINAVQNCADIVQNLGAMMARPTRRGGHDLESRSVACLFSKNPNQNPRSQTQQDRPLVAFVGRWRASKRCPTRCGSS